MNVLNASNNLVVVLFVIGSPLLQAADKEPSSLGLMDVGAVWRLVLSLAVLVVLIPAVVWGMKRLQKVQHKFSRSQIKVIESQHLGPKERLVLVEIENKRLLLGATSQQITVLCELGPSSRFADALAQAQQSEEKSGMS